MNAAILITGSGPIFILTSYDTLTNPKLIEKLSNKGIKKFIAYEVDEDLVKKKYGTHYSIIMGDLQQDDDLRVLDYDGHHVFSQIPFSEMHGPTYYEQ